MSRRRRCYAAAIDAAFRRYAMRYAAVFSYCLITLFFALCCFIRYFREPMLPLPALRFLPATCHVVAIMLTPARSRHCYALMPCQLLRFCCFIFDTFMPLMLTLILSYFTFVFHATLRQI